MFLDIGAPQGGEQDTKLELRRKKLEGAIDRLMTNEDFKRFMAELTCLQSLEDCGPTSNGHMLAYMTGRRSLMSQIKLSFFSSYQWYLIGEFDLNE